MNQPRFAPMSRAEMTSIGWDECDVVIVTGDAYIDHPSFGSAVIARVLIDAGFRTGIIAQPRWNSIEDFQQLGRPRLFFGVTAGNVDSLVNHYSPLKQRRRADAYSSGGKAGFRPNRASIVYCSRLREAFPGNGTAKEQRTQRGIGGNHGGRLMLVLGGIEASMRRLAHYDYWDDAVRRSILLDAKADIIAYGMAERAVVEIAQRVAAGRPLEGIPGTVIARRSMEPQIHANERESGTGSEPQVNASERNRKSVGFVEAADRNPDGTEPPRRRDLVGTRCGIVSPCLLLPSYEDVKADKRKFLEAFMTWYRESDQPKGMAIIQAAGDRCVVQYPPASPLSQQELDHVYDLPYERRPHPRYEKLGKIPALETVKFSITSHRGCLGSCSFCALAAHQGRIIQWRSEGSILKEARSITQMPEFRGHITDIGGPTANMYASTCPHLAAREPCRDRACLFPEPCPNLKHDLGQHLRVLEAVRGLPGVKKVSIGTGLRFDLLEGSVGRHYLEELCRHYISGQLRIAPEHVSQSVLNLMRKTSYARYQEFMRDFREINQGLGRKQYLIPYFISSFPGCTLDDMMELAEHIERKERFLIRQVQDFTPLPMTLATAMYYTEIDPFTGCKLSVAKDIKDKKLQRALMQLRDPENFRYVAQVLTKTGQRKLLMRASSLKRRKEIRSQNYELRNPHSDFIIPNS